MTADQPIDVAFALLLDSVTRKIADSAAKRAKGEISEEEHVNFVLRTVAALSPDTPLPIVPGEFIAPEPPPLPAHEAKSLSGVFDFLAESDSATGAGTAGPLPGGSIPPEAQESGPIPVESTPPEVQLDPPAAPVEDEAPPSPSASASLADETPGEDAPPLILDRQWISEPPQGPEWDFEETSEAVPAPENPEFVAEDEGPVPGQGNPEAHPDTGEMKPELEAPLLEPVPEAENDDKDRPLLVDEEWIPSEDDLFGELPPYPNNDGPGAAPDATASGAPLADLPSDISRAGQAPPPPSGGNEPKIGTASSIAPGARPVADTATAPPSSSRDKTAPPRPQPDMGKVIVSGRADWEQQGAVDLEDTMFRLGLEEEMVDDILNPAKQMKVKDREFITDGAKRMIQEANKTRDAGLALLLSLLLPGLGNLYAGSMLGIVFLIPAMGCIVAGVMQLAGLTAMGITYAVTGAVAGLVAASSVNQANARIRQAREARPQRNTETTFNMQKNGHG